MTGQIVPPDGLDRRAASGPIVVGDAIHISLRKGDPRLSLIGLDACHAFDIISGSRDIARRPSRLQIM
ncbi:hypothetical protein AX14_000545 [Amanita brunnescens Koide BX004]|nr:hypothetical protein AX14_000545 [Amanita brunnescens Koide BX004]